ncbi:aminopeptidase [Allocoprobacillus halotolerans]|uniref:Aminopeptidase n=1 Tax=Allocoprobacillus halotolerans TaxID=2944914 RepID=A0ABY5I7Y1_9FIRM|nr:aminopeptidase [Allocoprobacillus halotolerans]UTY40897.1 aminopeptidase [Allocoprobacillus halotolerans]
MLEKYAELIIKQGVNLQKGQELMIDASIDSYQLVRLLTKKLMKLVRKMSLSIIVMKK